MPPIQEPIMVNGPMISGESSFPQPSCYRTTEQRQEAPSYTFIHWGKDSATPYPLSDFSPKKHLQVERFIFCEIFHLSSARGSRLPGYAGQFREGSLSFPHRQGHTAPKWLQWRSRKPEVAAAGMLLTFTLACLPATSLSL